MILAFQKYSTGTLIENILTWNIPYEDSGFKRIYNNNFSDYTKTYRGYLFNDEIDGWNRIKYLNVYNTTSYIEDHYINLSTNLWVKNKNKEGSIDYRENISIIAYANSSYFFLLNISLELYDNDILINYINLTGFDFSGADIKYYYEWNLGYNYTKNHNYTVRMHGYDYTLLEEDYINALDYRKNKLTIKVKDHTDSYLINSYIFLESYPKHFTDDNDYSTYENLESGEYLYKVEKSGYINHGYDSINLTKDEIVYYELIKISESTQTYITSKLTDEESKKLFLPLIFLLLIIILITGLMRLAK